MLKALVAGADKIANVEKHLLGEGIEVAWHWTHNNGAVLPKACNLVLILGDFSSHNLIDQAVEAAKAQSVPIVRSQKSWSHLYGALEGARRRNQLPPKEPMSPQEPLKAPLLKTQLEGVVIEPPPAEPVPPKLPKTPEFTTLRSLKSQTQLSVSTMLKHLKAFGIASEKFPSAGPGAPPLAIKTADVESFLGLLRMAQEDVVKEKKDRLVRMRAKKAKKDEERKKGPTTTKMDRAQLFAALKTVVQALYKDHGVGSIKIDARAKIKVKYREVKEETL